MTPAELRRLAEAATPGPWNSFMGSRVCSDDVYDIALCEDASLEENDDEITGTQCDANAAYIAAVNPQTVLGLLDEIERLRLREDLAAVREHEAPKPSPAPKRVAVQIDMDSEDCLFALANDGTIHCGWYAGGEFSWQRQIPPLPQPEDAP